MKVVEILMKIHSVFIREYRNAEIREMQRGYDASYAKYVKSDQYLLSQIR